MMTVAELIKNLSAYPPDAIVRLCCDHGQMSMLASTITGQHMRRKNRESWMCDITGEIEPDDEHPINVVEIGAP